ncbi:MAG: hypothetical protein B6D36_03235 [Planctomycetes bacterium UTPLA1]|jgi:hypothetical protein|nr:MAG: hypothetical protein B6D36_03235 [Planctomycetes bacterium UTPLA1]
MLDKKTEQMLRIANVLTAEELDEIHGSTAMLPPLSEPADEADAVEQKAQEYESHSTDSSEPDATRGERERKRTRESKVSTACVGQPREPHTWWPIGTELVGQMGSEKFSATVIENTQVKSGCSVLITSGAAKGKLCLTPTRAAMEATEAYRQANGLGRGGGVTNGWSFWKAKQ